MLTMGQDSNPQDWFTLCRENLEEHYANLWAPAGYDKRKALNVNYCFALAVIEICRLVNSGDPTGHQFSDDESDWALVMSRVIGATPSSGKGPLLNLGNFLVSGVADFRQCAVNLGFRTLVIPEDTFAKGLGGQVIDADTPPRKLAEIACSPPMKAALTAWAHGLRQNSY